MKKFASPIVLILLLTKLYAQTSVSFLHLGNTTYQSSSLNPAWVPSDNKWLIGLPILSGIHVNVNSKLSYNETFTKESDAVHIYSDVVLSNLQAQNMVSASVSASLLHIGYRFDDGRKLSLFANERIEIDALFPKEVVDVVWNGNRKFVNEEINIGRVGARATHFREIGLGYAAPVNEYLDFGVRAKLLVGFYDISTPGNMKVNITTDGEIFQIGGELQNAQIRSSGRDIYGGSEGDLGSHLAFNSNTGYAFDFGFNYKLSKYYSFAGSILDIGRISWKEDIRNETLRDTTFYYDGVELDGLSDIRQTLVDSLFSKFDTERTDESYSSWLPLKAYGSWIYHYRPGTDLYATVGTRVIHGQIKMLYGGGLTHRFGKVFTGSLTATKLPQQFFNTGAAFVVNGGPVQLYMAVDQIINFSIPDAKSFDFRFGINFRIRGNGDGSSGGSSGENVRFDDPKGYNTNTFLGKSIKTKRRDGIYSVIKKQKKREIRNNGKKKKKVVKKSLNGRTGKRNSHKKKH